MDLVVDANVLLSALIKEGLTRKLMLNSSVTLYAPEFLLDEFAKHISVVSKKSGIPVEKLKPLVKEFFDETKIMVFATPELNNFMSKARVISPDPDDAIYFALALKLDCSIWSNDKKLKEQSKVRVYSTKEVAELISKM